MRVLSLTPWTGSWQRTRTCWSAISLPWCSSPSTRSSRPSSRRGTWSEACDGDPPPLPLSSKSPLVLLSIIWARSLPTSSGVSSPTRTGCQGTLFIRVHEWHIFSGCLIWLLFNIKSDTSGKKSANLNFPSETLPMAVERNGCQCVLQGCSFCNLSASNDISPISGW